MSNKLLATLLVAVALGTAPAIAQESLDSRWLPWLGCWQPADESPGSESLLICVRPTPSGSGVEVATVSDVEVLSTRTLVADGQLHNIQDESCTGWQSASFAGDGRRVFLHSELTCQGGATRSASAIMAIASPTVWLDAQSVGMGGERMPRVMKYRLVAESSAPTGFALTARQVAAAADARLLASAELSLEDVSEAAPRVDPEALVAFLMERDQAFDLDAASVSQLADAGVPNEVIDVLVAVSFPNRFVIDREARRLAMRPEEQGERRGGRRGYGGPFGWGGWGWGWDYCYGGFWYGSLYCSPYARGYGRGFGWYNPYFAPVIVVRDDRPAAGSGRVVRGRGYTRGGRPASDPDTRTAQPRDRSGGSSSPSVRSGGGSSSGSASPSGYSGGSRSGSSGSSGTAQRRPPK